VLQAPVDARVQTFPDAGADGPAPLGSWATEQAIDDLGCSGESGA
jgi:hypothetical protein